MARRAWFLVTVGAGVLVARALSRLDPVRVAGPSMRPTLEPGDLVAVRGLRPREPAVGQVVVARSADREVIKRVGVPPRALPYGEVWLEGDDRSRSTDSRTTGPVAREDVVGVVVARYWPPARARLFR